MKNSYKKVRSKIYRRRHQQNQWHYLLFSLALLTLLLDWNTIQAQPNYTWANGIPAGFSQSTNTITADDNGNVYVTGRFSNTVDFDPGPATASLTSTGLDDIFIAKYDIDGNYVWAKPIHGGIRGEGWSIALDENNNIYVTGNFTGMYDFDPDPGNTVNITSTSTDLFIAKYDNNGNYKWAHGIGGNKSDQSFSLEIDPAGGVYVAGIFRSDTVDFDPGVGTKNLTTVTEDMFLAKYDTAGNYVWAFEVNASATCDPRTIGFDSQNNVIVAGFFNGVVDFDPAVGVATNHTSVGTRDIFLAKYDSNGNYLWAGNPEGTGNNDFTYQLVIDEADNIYISGELRDTVDFDFSANVFDLHSAGSGDIFIAKYNAAGDFIWAKSVGSVSQEIAIGFAIDQHQHLVVTGTFEGKVDFDPGTGAGDTAFLTPQAFPGVDSYIASYDTNGNYLWTSGLGGSGFSLVFSTSLEIDDKDNLYAAGIFGPGNIDFDLDTGKADTAFLSTPGFFGKVFFAKYRLCFSDTTFITDQLCNGSTYTLGSQSITTAGTYSEVFSSAICGDSIVSLSLSLVTIDTSVNRNGGSLIANLSGATYQWVDCAVGPISGANSQSFTPTKTGNYAVIVTENGCTMRSSCHHVIVTGVNEFVPVINYMSVYPNPTDGTVSIKIDRPTTILISNSIGKVVHRTTLPAGINELDLNHLPAGIYVVSNEQQHFKLIVE